MSRRPFQRNDHDTQEQEELRMEVHSWSERYYNAQAYISELQRRINSQHRYITELEKQLEPSVVAEIRTELSAQEEGENADL